MFYGVIRISLLFRKSRNITIYLGSEERESYLIRETVYWNIWSLWTCRYTRNGWLRNQRHHGEFVSQSASGQNMVTPAYLHQNEVMLPIWLFAWMYTQTLAGIRHYLCQDHLIFPPSGTKMQMKLLLSTARPIWMIIFVVMAVLPLTVYHSLLPATFVRLMLNVKWESIEDQEAENE